MINITVKLTQQIRQELIITIFYTTKYNNMNGIIYMFVVFIYVDNMFSHINFI